MPANAVSEMLIPFAACGAESWLPAMRAMPPDGMKRLGQLLRRMALVHSDSGVAESLSPPHERALGRALGLAGQETPDGLIPWAASDAAMALPAHGGKAWAWITPCHWAMGHLHATLSDPAALALREGESRELLAVMRPYFETDGIALHYLAPERWMAEGEVFRKLPTASLDRVLARNVDAWLLGAGGTERRAGPPQASSAPPEGSAVREATSVGARALTRLQNEMQMLLYTHPFNDARQARWQMPVNSFWISGTGDLPATAGSGEALTPALSQGQMEKVNVPRSLADAVFKEDWLAYSQAWQALDDGEIARLLARQQAGKTVRLTLCGERNALTFETRPATLRTKISRLFSPLRMLDVLEQL